MQIGQTIRLMWDKPFPTSHTVIGIEKGKFKLSGIAGKLTVDTISRLRV